jgi:hypothetical protein
MIDDTIQKSIIQSPDSYKLYQLIQSITNADSIISPIFVFVWVIGTITYIFYKIKD